MRCVLNRSWIADLAACSTGTQKPKPCPRPILWSRCSGSGSPSPWHSFGHGDRCCVATATCCCPFWRHGASGEDPLAFRCACSSQNPALRPCTASGSGKGPCVITELTPKCYREHLARGPRIGLPESFPGSFSQIMAENPSGKVSRNPSGKLSG